MQQAIANDPCYALALAYIAQWYRFKAGEIGSTELEPTLGVCLNSLRLSALPE